MAKHPKASPLLQAITDARRAARRTLTRRELDAACRAYWEHEGTDDGPWAMLPEEGRRNVRRRIVAVLAAIGMGVDE